MEHDRDALLARWRVEEERPFAGWDFSHLDGRWQEHGPSWSYPDLVRRHATGASSLLDIGTGGGELLLGLRDALPGFTVAVEGHPPNIRLAAGALRSAGVPLVGARVATDDALPFADGSFAVVINRHAAFRWSEVERLLEPGGVFVSQQVGGRDLADLMAVFGAEHRWPDSGLARSRHWLEHTTGLDLEQAREELGTLTFTDVGAVVFLLRAVPWLVDGFRVDTHRPGLLALQRRLERDGRLTFQTHRYLLVARKREWQHAPAARDHRTSPSSLHRLRDASDNRGDAPPPRAR
jgi:SAM-dependent methyltransferase